MVKVAEFRKYLYDEPVVPVPIINNECMVPSEVTGGKAWYIKVIGKRGDMIIALGMAEHHFLHAIILSAKHGDDIINMFWI